MRRLLSTRYGFFGLAALVCWALIPVIDREFRWVAIGVGGLYIILALLFLGEDLTRATPRRSESARDD